MNEIPKYNRLINYKYTTGDSQEYTREYTWEDWVAASMMLDRTPGTEHAMIINSIYNFFKEHPEKLLEGGPAKSAGVSVEDLNRYFESDDITKPTWWI